MSEILWYVVLVPDIVAVALSLLNKLFKVTADAVPTDDFISPINIFLTTWPEYETLDSPALNLLSKLYVVGISTLVVVEETASSL